MRPKAYAIAMFPITLLMVIATLGMTYRADPFEKTKWKIDLVNADGGAKDSSDVIAFKGGKFTSTYFAKHGFKETNYDEDTRRGGIAAFTVEQASEKEGKLKWGGQVTATSIRGDITWTKPDGSTVTYTFTGERLPQEK